MSEAYDDQGFFQSGGYYEQNQGAYDMGGGTGGPNDFPQDPQFGQFDYGQQQQQHQQQHQSPYGESPYMNPPPMQQGYTGSIMTPDPVQPYGQDVENMEDEPPLMEELGINPNHIVQKTLAVLNPLKSVDTDMMQDTDLAGPFVFCLAFGGTLLLAGKVQFGYIYGLGVVGSLAMYALLNLMSMTGVSASQIVSILGYCLLPMVLLSAFAILISLQGILGTVLTSLAVIWCALSASKLFVSALAMDQQQLLVAYPCALVYGVFALLTVF